VSFFRNFAVALACAVAIAPIGAARAADPPGPNPIAACAAPFYATKVDGDPNVVVVRAIDLTGPLAGTITAFGADTMWTGKIERAAMTEMPYGGQEASINVRANGPIDGIAYTPAWATCTFYAGARPRKYSDAHDVDRPTLTVGDPQPAEPATCGRPYVPIAVKRAEEPQQPASGDMGLVRVAVAVDERGNVRYARVVASAAASLNPSAVDAARRSEYAPAVFRCKNVPSGYQFNVQYG
jgi:hypothetical protein